MRWMARERDGRGCSGSFVEPLEPRRHLSTGDLDETFSLNGRVTTDVFSKNNGAAAVAVQGDRKIVVAGATATNNTDDILLIRYNADGTLDETFGVGGTEGNGKVVHDLAGFGEIVTSMVLQRDGKIVVAGQTTYQLNVRAFVARFNKDGTPDATFDGDGYTLPNFGVNGAIINDIAVQDNGAIVAVGAVPGITSNDSRLGIARLTKFGSPDFTFSGSGVGVWEAGSKNDSANGVAIQPDGKIVITGRGDGVNLQSTETDGFVWRFKTDGKLDEGFGTAGKTVIGFPDSDDRFDDVVIMPSGQIVLAGRAKTLALTWLVRADGVGIGGSNYDSRGQEDYYTSIVARSDGRVIAVGTTLDNGSVRVLVDRFFPSTNGLFKEGFTNGPALFSANPFSYGADAFIAPDGQLVIAGTDDPTPTGTPAGDIGVMRLDGFDDASASVSGRIFKDKNADGERDDNDSGHSGVRVYVDEDRDGEFDPFTEPSALTDANGKYIIPGLIVSLKFAGSVRVREVVPRRYRQTLPAKTYYNTTLKAGENSAKKDFGNTQRVLVNGYVYRDDDEDGMFAEDETTLKGFRVFIDADRDGTFDEGERSVRTGENGFWSFGNLDDGLYIVRIMKRDGYKATNFTKLRLDLDPGDARTGATFGQVKIA